MSFVLALDQGTTSSRAILFDRGGAVHARRASGVPADLSAARLGRARRRRKSGRRSRASLHEALAKARRRRRATSPRSASPTSARRPWSGSARPGGRSPTPSSGRTGAPRRCATSCARLVSSRCSRAKTGLVIDPYFSGTKMRWLLDNVDGARARARARRARVRHGRSWLVWQLTGGRVALHRRDQRVPHAAVQHPHRRLGRRAARACSTCRARCCRESCASSGSLRRRRADRRRRRADRGDRRRSAGGAVRPGVPRARAWRRTPTAPAASC